MSTRDAYFIRPMLGLRHPVSGLSHAAGALLAAAGLASLLTSVAQYSTRHLVGALVFGASMFLLFAASSLYHLSNVSEPSTRRLRQLDHSMIYVFIAGSYTPFCLLPFRQGAGPWLLTLVWALALLGIVIKLVWLETSRWVRVAPYVALSLISVIALPELCRILPASGLAWLFGGAAAYLVGACVYASRRPDPWPEVFGFHEIWHLFVLAGAFSHFWLVRTYVLTL